MSPLSLLLLAPLLPGILAQSVSSNSTSLIEFRLLRCDNHLTQYGSYYADPSHTTNITWNQIALFTQGILPNNTPAALDTIFHAVPFNALPYQPWDGFSTSAFFFPKQGPHGWLSVEIPKEINGQTKKLGEKAGRVVFEGVDFNCAKAQGGLSDEGSTGCEGEFCARYMYCQPRYLCRRKEYPVEVTSCYKNCYPQWPGGA